jgi:hypothetical protein
VNLSRRVVHVPMASARAGLAAAGLALVLAGCSATNPATISTPFDPGDGRSAQIGGEPGTGGGDGNYRGNGGIKLRNFLIVSEGQGKPGVVVGAISNDTGQNVTVQLEVAAKGGDGQQQSLGSTSIPLAPQQFVQLGNPAGLSGSASPSSSRADATVPAAGPYVWFQVPSVPAASGSVLQLFARTPALGGASLSLPILPPVEEYANLTPTGSATASPSPTSSPTGSPQPSPNPSAASQSPSPSSS